MAAAMPPSLPTTVTVTPTVAQVLKRLGLSKKLYRVIDVDDETSSPRIRWDDALRFSPPIGRRRVGDVIEFICPAKKKAQVEEMARVEEVSDDGDELRVRVVMRATDVVGPCARQNELYLTTRTLDITDLHVFNLVEPSSFIMRRTHDEMIGPYWSSIESRTSPAAAVPLSTLHQHDFIYLMPNEQPAVFRVCQIISLKRKNDDRLIARLQPFVSDDSHRLRPQGSSFTCANLQRDMVRKCTVIVTDHAVPPKGVVKALVDVFWARREDISGSCKACEEEMERRRKQAAAKPSLKVLDLCAGAGGLSIGLHLAGGLRPRIKTKWAVETNASAAATFRKAFGSATVYTQCMSSLLPQLLAHDPTDRPRPDVIIAGTPCQGFSGLNRKRDPEDPRNFLVFNALSYVEASQPSYFVMENVEGMVSSSMSVGKERQGFVKVIVLALIELGYNVRLCHVQAARCGAATMRDRVVVLASKEGLPLPRQPAATNVVSSSPPGGEKLTLCPSADGPTRQYRCYSDDEWAQGCAPHHATTAQDALRDLPLWDWKDPESCGSSYQDSKQDRELKRRREEEGIPVYEAVATSSSSSSSTTTHLVGPYRQPYASKQKNVYQSLMRYDGGGGSAPNNVTQHQTPRLGVLETERVVQLPFRRGVNHDSWSSSYVNRPMLAPSRLVDPQRAFLASSSSSTPASNTATSSDRKRARQEELDLRRNDFAYRRIEADKPCAMLFTTAAPGAHRAPSIHYNAARVLTLRERARIQGFPDQVEFVGSPAEVQEQVGNAVPVPLGMAIGKRILESWDEVVGGREGQDGGGQPGKRKRKAPDGC